MMLDACRVCASLHSAPTERVFVQIFCMTLPGGACCRGVRDRRGPQASRSAPGRRHGDASGRSWRAGARPAHPAAPLQPVAGLHDRQTLDTAARQHQVCAVSTFAACTVDSMRCTADSMRLHRHTCCSTASHGLTTWRHATGLCWLGRRCSSRSFCSGTPPPAA